MKIEKLDEALVDAVAEEVVIPERIIEGMGAIVHANGVAFRVWAPFAQAVSVAGDFNDWQAAADPLRSEGNGYWYCNVPRAKAGQEYRFCLKTLHGEDVMRVDPYARAVVNSIGNSIIYDVNAFDWEGDDFHLPAWNELVIYELHVGSFNREPDQGVGCFDHVLAKIEHLKTLGVNAIEIMPIAEFAGDQSWGYNPSHIFAVESAYGGPDALKRFVKEMHTHGIGVLLDVVYNHFGPSDLDLWRFDGWSEGDGGGIYFYNDWRAGTPWGHTRPDYGREEVRRYLLDNARMWMDEYHIDGLRYDATVHIRKIKHSPGEPDLEEGWSMMQWINTDVAERHPGRIVIAEDLQNNEWLTKTAGEGGAHFGAQWDANFVHPIREAVIVADDAHRSMAAVCHALQFKYNGAAFQRVIYSESHDEVANGRARVPYEINPDDAQGKFAQKRSALAAALVFTAPGIPMIFQGQEFLQGEWFRDDVPLDWELQSAFRGIVRLYRDLIRLRLNRDGLTKGLTGEHIHVHHASEEHKMVAFQRWYDGGAGDHVVIIANFSAQPQPYYRIGLPQEGMWRLRFNSDFAGYSEAFDGHESLDVEAFPEAYDGQPYSGHVSIAPYTVLIYSQDRA